MNYQEQGAFPCHAQVDSLGNPVIYAEQGMTLRDYFAAKAMQAQISNSFISERYGLMPNLIAKEAYSFADAMMEAREVKRESNV